MAESAAKSTGYGFHTKSLHEHQFLQEFCQCGNSGKNQGLSCFAKFFSKITLIKSTKCKILVLSQWEQWEQWFSMFTPVNTQTFIYFSPPLLVHTLLLCQCDNSSNNSRLRVSQWILAHCSHTVTLFPHSYKNGAKTKCAAKGKPRSSGAKVGLPHCAAR